MERERKLVGEGERERGRKRGVSTYLKRNKLGKVDSGLGNTFAQVRQRMSVRIDSNVIIDELEVHGRLRARNDKQSFFWKLLESIIFESVMAALYFYQNKPPSSSSTCLHQLFFPLNACKKYEKFKRHSLVEIIHKIERQID